jgi:polyhydroxyalkanoate synthesis regulator phasin
MPSKLDELRRRAQQTARELDEKYKITSKLDEGARKTTEALRKGADVATATLDDARREAGRIDRENRISERVTETARRAVDAADDALNRAGVKKKAGEVVDTASAAAREAGSRAADVAAEAKEKATDFFGEARRYYEQASGAARTTASAARLPSSLATAMAGARRWAKRNPGKAAVVSLAFVAGTRLGAAFTSLDVTLLGAGGAGSWLFHSALAPYGLRKLAERYEKFLKKQEELIAAGKLSEAEAARVKFQRDAAKYVGAPLLGAFSIAAGAGLVAEAFTGGVVTGFPINLVLGGNPMLSSIWLFGNGLVCFHNGYKFFMMAFGDREEVARVVRDIKGLLPEVAAETI